MLLTPLPWLNKGIYWALPVLTILCPSARYYQDIDKQQKKLTDWARQIIFWLARHTRHLKRAIYLTGDGSFATFDLFISGKKMEVNLIARMKLTARLFDFPAKDRPSNIPGPKPDIGKRLKSMVLVLADPATKWTKVVFSEWYGKKKKKMMVTSGIAIWYKSKTVMVEVKWVLIKDPEGELDPVLLACTDTTLSVKKIVQFFVRRWRVEVTFEELRRHLGVESQRQWSDLAIDRSTPCLMALFSIVCLMANGLHKHHPITPNTTAWYDKKDVTFSDILAAVRIEIWRNAKLSISHFIPDVGNYTPKIRHLWFLLTQAVA